jgi:hypothetical protein
LLFEHQCVREAKHPTPSRRMKSLSEVVRSIEVSCVKSHGSLGFS